MLHISAMESCSKTAILCKLDKTKKNGTNTFLIDRYIAPDVQPPNSSTLRVSFLLLNFEKLSLKMLFFSKKYAVFCEYLPNVGEFKKKIVARG